MKPLKAITHERIYWNCECVERVAGDCDVLHLDDQDYYLKSEADKVIADLEDKLRAANEQIENLINSASSIMLFQNRVNDNKCGELRHAKYKRCLAIADLCFRECQTYRALIERGEEHFSKMDFYGRWNKIWLILAEKFKEAK